ncbi:hypothetical protein RCG17_23720 [Neobacillus sp. PS3-12]|uniref:hypothetical protein n=1 Tax=Neobacillus sp. PS3-12 TaxID=3070677 RepID=UPI0027E07FE2|nr:hypothetical protein [Neobacillus sp. PS3-12]WML52353.1 hypothetical protein RCG17_23720 [Neobacillus sp. PS3-12]
MRKYLAEKIETYLFIQLPKPSEYPNVLKISAGDYWCIQNNGWSTDSATEIFSEEWISDDEFFVTESETIFHFFLMNIHLPKSFF